MLLEKLAAGGMAEVYLAKSTGASGINKFIAIKRILPQYSDHPEFIDMFKEEAKIAVNLNHGNVVSIFDFGVEKNQFFLVMEYVEGQNLRQVLNHLKKENKFFSIDQIVYIIKEVAAGLDHAHRCLDGTTGRPLNITHRDMSPQNIMLSFEGEVKVVDFGIAKAESQIETTRAGTIKGKFGYMSPEQADGQQVDPRTDIFSLGIVLWELLANERLFVSNSEAATLKKIRECQIPNLKKLNPAIPAELERIVAKALAKDKNLRYQTAAAFHRDLNRFLNTQYPEFSSQDFSMFMKSAFAAMFLENRKKLIEFAKIKTADIDQTSITNTQTQTDASEPEEGPSLKLNIEAESAPVILSELRKTGPAQSPRFYNDEMSRASRPHLTASRPQMAKKKEPLTPLVSTLTVVLILASGYFGLGALGVRLPFLPSPQDTSSNQTGRSDPQLDQQDKAQAPATEINGPSVAQRTAPIRQQDMASQRALYPLIIQSVPSGARISIDGQDTGMITPAQRSMEAGREFTLALRKDGYQYYERKEVAGESGKVIKASLLPMPKMGYINLDLINGGSNPKVFINDLQIDEKMPLRNYAVIAGAPVKIQAHNPFTGLSAARTVTVGPNQRIQVNLILSARKPSSSK